MLSDDFFIDVVTVLKGYPAIMPKNNWQWNTKVYQPGITVVKIRKWRIV